jgi:hypothetical protein
MEFIKCRNCGHPYLPGEASYCGKCGHRLPTQKNLVDEVNDLESEPKPYGAVRFTSGLVVFLGWVWIILGWMLSFTVGSVFGESLAQFFVRSDAGYSVIRNFTALIVVILGFINTIYGIGMIAGGQLISIMLDIRNDTHSTMRLVRRFGLMIPDETRSVTGGE